MNKFDRFVEDAAVQYSDWKGTLALDDPDQPGLLAARLGVDADRWWVLGLNLAHYQGYHHVSAYVVDRDVVPNYESLQALAAEHGGVVPVIEIQDTGLRFDEVLALFKRSQFIALARHQIVTPGHRLRVVETTSLGHDSPSDR